MAKVGFFRAAFLSDLVLVLQIQAVAGL